MASDVYRGGEHLPRRFPWTGGRLLPLVPGGNTGSAERGDLGSSSRARQSNPPKGKAGSLRAPCKPMILVFSGKHVTGLGQPRKVTQLEGLGGAGWEQTVSRCVGFPALLGTGSKQHICSVPCPHALEGGDRKHVTFSGTRSACSYCPRTCTPGPPLPEGPHAGLAFSSCVFLT